MTVLDRRGGMGDGVALACALAILLVGNAAAQSGGVPKAVPSPRLVAVSTEAGDGGRSYALVIGINDYQHLGDLKYCRQDAEQLAEVLQQRAGFSRVVLLTDAATRPEDRPTAGTVRFSVEQMAQLARKDDTLLVFFAGHGDTIDGEDCLMPVDAYKAQQSAVSFAWITGQLSGSPARCKTLILDMCRPGSTRSVARLAIDPKADPGVTVLTSCQSGQTSHEEDGHGVFSRHLVDGMSGAADKNDDGAVTQQELFSYIEGGMIDWCFQKRKLQTPTMSSGAEGGQVVARVPNEVRLAAERERLYEEAIARGERSLLAHQWAAAEAAFGAALRIPGYSADPKALEGLKDAGLGAQQQQTKAKYDAALSKAQEARLKARRTGDAMLWETTKGYAEQAIATGYSETAAARQLLDEAMAHLVCEVTILADLEEPGRIGLIVTVDGKLAVKEYLFEEKQRRVSHRIALRRGTHRISAQWTSQHGLKQQLGPVTFDVNGRVIVSVGDSLNVAPATR